MSMADCPYFPECGHTRHGDCNGTERERRNDCTRCGKTVAQREFNGCGKRDPEASACPYFDRDNKPLTFASHPVSILASLTPGADPAKLDQLRAICDAPADSPEAVIAQAGEQTPFERFARRVAFDLSEGLPNELTGERLYGLWSAIGTVQGIPSVLEWSQLNERARQSWSLMAECLNEWGGANDG